MKNIAGNAFIYYNNIELNELKLCPQLSMQSIYSPKIRSKRHENIVALQSR